MANSTSGVVMVTLERYVCSARAESRWRAVFDPYRGTGSSRFVMTTPAASTIHSKPA